MKNPDGSSLSAVGFLLGLILAGSLRASGQEFIGRSGTDLVSGTDPFLFAGVNAPSLPHAASYGEESTVDTLLSVARSLGLKVIRFWAFYDSPDSTDAAVLQLKPGSYNEQGLRGLDIAVARAKGAGMRIVLPLVNNWDDYGGMNQYVRWRMEGLGGPLKSGPLRYTHEEEQQFVTSGRGERYQVALSGALGHDDFYRDEVIKSWYKQYVSMLLERVNTQTGVAFKDEPAILGWELANEPRSSDRTGETVYQWLAEMSAFVKTVDSHHLVASGEEGLDIGATSYPLSAASAPRWLLDGSGGVSYQHNTALPFLDFASIHLYSDGWAMPASTGNTWIREHVRLAHAEGKPAVLGEYGARVGKVSIFSSWTTTAALDGAAGALAWQLLESSRRDDDGFGFACPEDPVCAVLEESAAQFAQKASGGMAAPTALRLLPNYPNPFNARTVIAYELPWNAFVVLELFDITGARIGSLVNDVQTPGLRRELLDVGGLASGVYVYRVRATSLATGERAEGVGKVSVLK